MARRARNLAEKMQSLTDEQLAEVEDFMEFIRLRGQDRSLAHTTSRASEPALAAIWNNPEDDAYDAL